MGVKACACDVARMKLYIKKSREGWAWTIWDNLGSQQRQTGL